jgi:hypothetical protein
MRPVAVSGIGDDRAAKMHFVMIAGVLAVVGYIFWATLEGPRAKP